MKTKSLLLLLLMAGIAGGVVYADPVEAGKTIFSTRCAACHNINKVIIGPALAGVDQRHPIEWIVSFVHGSQSMVKAGDKDAVALFEKFNKVPMPDHPDLKEEDIKGIVAYIKSESKSAETTAAPFAKPGKRRADNRPLSKDDAYFFLVYLGTVAMLIRALVYAVQIKTYTRERETALILGTGHATIIPIEQESRA
jgi:mono/diheme cytochrome c family protein